MKELLQRWQANMPPFFKKLLGLFLALSGACTSALAMPEFLPAWSIELFKTGVVVGLVGAAVCKFTVNFATTDPACIPDLQQPYPPLKVNITPDQLQIDNDNKATDESPA